MEIISRKAAKARGLTRYFTGKPCCRGHIAARSVSNKGCTACASDHQRQSHKRAFNSQIYAAQKRGIPFHFTFEEWGEWWEANLGPNWFEQRGCRHGQFVMARIGDAGPYEPGNVECVPAERNHSARVANGKARGGSLKGQMNPASKLDAQQVMQIYRSSERAVVLSHRYGVSRPVIDGIRKGCAWKHITNGGGTCQPQR